MTTWGKEIRRGSQKWLQIAINQKPDILDSVIRQHSSFLDREETITWLSPLKSQKYKEYRDKEFLDELGIKLTQRPIPSFWPRNGPLWDGLGKTSNGKLLLVEAKSHIAEINSAQAKAKERSLPRIRASFEEVRKGLGLRKKIDWSGNFYQYANRISYLYLLRKLNAHPAYLIFLYFLNDSEMKGPTSVEEWQGAIKLVEICLGLPQRHKLSEYILKLYLNISLLQ